MSSKDSSSSSDDSTSKRHLASDDDGADLARKHKKARAWTRAWQTVPTASGEMRILAWASAEPRAAEYRLSCQECSKKFDDAAALKRHVRTHLGKSRNVCPVCQKGFPDASKLRRHQTSLKHDAPSRPSILEEELSQFATMKSVSTAVVAE
ncbi:hypothetical protein PBRA_003330 [Plasmodiophora brassicae]|nr:hypothetical protein PBRA_003330 [Plasmodiophora brassicae]